MRRAFRTLAALGRAATIDLDFYRSHYEDLDGRSKAQCLRHFISYGFQEGRFPNYAAARRTLEARHGALPSGFRPGLYALLNPDLGRVLGGDRRLTLHYIEHGRLEGRRHAPDVADAPSWAALLRPADVLAWSAAGHGAPTSRREAEALFVRRGVPDLIPLALDLVFDPAFFRSVHAPGDRRTDAELYRAWLEGGLERGQAPNEAKALDPMLAGERLPPGFDWMAWRAQLPSRRARTLRTRVEVIRHLFETAGRGTLPATGPEMDLLVARYRHRRRFTASAERLYERVLAATGHLPTRDLHRLADLRRRGGDAARALDAFLEAGRRADASVWSVVGAVDLLAEAGRFADAFDEIATRRARFDGAPPFRAAVARTVEGFHARALRRATEGYARGDRDAADDALRASLDATAATIERLEAAPAPIGRGTGPIVLIATMALPQCKHYRVDQKVEQIRAFGERVAPVDVADVAACRNALLDARLVVFYRVPATPDVLRLIREATALAIPTFYDIDDLIFDRDHYPEAPASYGGLIDDADYAGLLSDVPTHRFAMARCGIGIASTPPLAGRVAAVAGSGTCHLWPNALDADRWAEEPGEPGPPSRPTVTILYGSGTKAHTKDFADLVSPALDRLLARAPAVRLTVVGHVDLHPRFDRFGARVVRLPVVERDAYLRLLARADIALAVLHPSVVADCKSEIKWLEAAAFAVPAVVTPTEAHRLALRDEHDVLFAASPDAWERALARLVAQPDLRARIGRAARETARARYGLAACRRALDAVLEAARDSDARATGAADRPRVLVVNVFFPPQSFGGATRVVADAVDHLAADGAFAVCVFATDQGAPGPGRLRYDSHRGTPVVRIAVDEGKDDGDLAVDPAPAAAFERLLDVWRPDLVHFHCIQRLGPALVAGAAARGVPYLVTVHDGWWASPHQFFVDPDGFPRLPSPAPVGAEAERRRVLMPLLRDADAVVAVSDSFADLHRALGLANVVALPNGVAGGIASRHVDRADGRVRLGHLGGRSVQKGATLVEAVLRRGNFGNLDLLMVDHALERGERVDALWGTTPVTLVGPAPPDEVGALYGALDVLLAPSVWPESFGLVTREALAGGLWVVASDRGAVADGVTEGVNGFVVDVADGAGLAAVLGRMDGNPAAFSAGPAGPPPPMRSARDHARDTAALYARVLAARRSRAGGIALRPAVADKGGPAPERDPP